MMQFLITAIPLEIAIFLALCAWGSVRLSRAAQPLRLQLAEEGNLLLASPYIGQRQRDFIKYGQRSAFGHRFVMLFGVLFVPAFALTILVARRSLDGSGSRMFIEDAATRAQFHHFLRLHNRITLLNHPILAMLIDLEVTLFVAPAITLSAIFSGKATEKVNHDSTMGLIEEKTMDIRQHIPLRLKAA